MNIDRHEVYARLADAVRIYESQPATHTVWRLCWGFWSSRIHYYLGVAYEDSRWYDKAIERYTMFLEIYQDADAGIAEVDDPWERLTQLRQSRCL